MPHIDGPEAENLLLALEASGNLFPEYRLCRKGEGLQQLGKGSSALVFEMECIADPREHFALKVIGLAGPGVPPAEFEENVSRQKQLAKESAHIVQVVKAVQLQVFLDGDGHFLRCRKTACEEPADDGILLQFLLMEKLEPLLVWGEDAQPDQPPVRFRRELYQLPELTAFAWQVGRALQTAHEHKILHRDVKLENIFWDQAHGCYKLGDFGGIWSSEKGRAETVAYTEGYRAPEIKKQGPIEYDKTADIYSFGICLYLLLNDLCFPGEKNYFVREAQYSEGFVLPAPKHASKSVARVLRKFCSCAPANRYQSVTEGLAELDFSAQEDAPEDAAEAAETVMETIQSTETMGTVSVPHQSKLLKIPLRIKRRIERKADQRLYRHINGWLTLTLTAVFTMMLCSWNGEASALRGWPFWILLGAAVTETALLKINDLHISFALVSVVFGVWAMKKYGANLPVALLILCIASQIEALSFAGGLSGALWAWLNLSGEVSRLSWAASWDLGWLFLLLALLFSFFALLIACAGEKVGALAICGHMLFFFLLVPGAVAAALLWPLLAETGQWMRAVHPIRIGLVYVPLFYYICKWLIKFGKEADDESDFIEK